MTRNPSRLARDNVVKALGRVLGFVRILFQFLGNMFFSVAPSRGGVHDRASEFVRILREKVKVRGLSVVRKTGCGRNRIDRFFERGYRQKVLVGEVGVVEHYFVIGKSDYGISRGFVRRLDFFGRFATVGHRGVNMKISLIELAFVRYKILFHGIASAFRLTKLYAVIAGLSKLSAGFRKKSRGNTSLSPPIAKII